MIKYSLTPLSEANKHFQEAKPGDCICWKSNENGYDIPFGISSNPQNAEEDGIDRIENEDINYQGYQNYFTIITPDKTKDGPVELINFSFIFEYEVDEQNPYEYMEEYGLTIGFSDQPYQWIGSFGNPNEINEKISNRDDQGSYFLIDTKSDQPEDIELKILETPSFNFIEAIRQCMNLKTAEAEKLLKISKNEWKSFIFEKNSMNKWQWSIFMYLFQKQSKKLFFKIMSR